jgi:hypothetical protein
MDAAGTRRQRGIGVVPVRAAREATALITGDERVARTHPSPRTIAIRAHRHTLADAFFTSRSASHRAVGV